MKTTIPKLFVILLTVVCAMYSCGRSPQAGYEELAEQKRVWVEEMKVAFPERTTDTVELRKQLEYFIGTGNKMGQQILYRVLGNQARNSSRFRTAIEYHTTGLQISYELRDTINIAMVLNDLATDFRRIGAFDEAVPYHYLALEITEAYRGSDRQLNQRNMASAYNGIGSVCREMGEFEEALSVYHKALELEIRHDNFRGMAINYANIGAIHFDRGEFELAESNYIISLKNNEKAGLSKGIALCRMNIGRIYEVQGRLDDALREFEQAYEVMSGTSDKWHWLDACFFVAEILIRKGDYARVERYLDDGMTVAREINSMKHLQEAHKLYSIWHYDRGDYRRSVEDMRTAQAYTDTLSRNLEVDRLLESKVKYETSNYSRQIEELDALNREQAARQRTVTMVTITAIIVLAGILLMVLYRRRMERRRAAEVRELERMRSNFFTNITHEFRTPVTVINGLIAHLLAEMKDEVSRRTVYMDAVRRQGNQLMHLVNQLLEFSRAEAGVNLPKWRSGDMVEFLRVVAEPYAQYAKSRGIELFVYAETESLRMNFVPSSMRKVLGNLLSNAIKHCGEGDSIVVHFRQEAATGRCLISVKDTGDGIAPENLAHIFELYYTAGGNMGSGIGLALSKQLVEEAGGTITVASTPGKGTEFTVSLPVSVAAIPESEREMSNEDGTEAPGGYLELPDFERDDDGKPLATVMPDGKKSVLVVEDNRDVAHYISTILADKYAVLHAVNGNEGLRMAEEHVPDLIITDVMMPEKDGYAFTAELRAGLAVSHIPVIIITAKGTTEDKLEGLKAGADAYLPKPFDERELLVRIEQLLESRAMLMKKYSDAMLGGGDGGAEENAAADSTDPHLIFIARLSVAINNHLDDESWFPDGLAAEMCLSVSQLYRKLKAMTGHTVSSFVMRTRLIKARQMLSKGDVSIKDAAFSCGFSNQSYFSRSFKDEFGYTPSQFLKTTGQQTTEQ